MLQFECYCLSKTTQDAFNCVICNKMHHNKCYNINFMERMPLNIKCITCRLTQYEPFYQIKENLYQKQYFILNAENYVKREIHFDLKNRYNDYKHNINWEIVIVCTPIKPTVKKAVNDPTEQHLKKNKVAPQYEWPSPNIFLEWNKTHIKYSLHSFAVVYYRLFIKKSSRFCQDSQYLIVYCERYKFQLFYIPQEQQSFLTAFMVDKRKQLDITSKIKTRWENDTKIPINVKSYYKETINRTILAAANDEQCLMLQSPYLTINLMDPLTFEQLDIPVKGMRCEHIECFDFYRFLENNNQPKENRWKCPKCLEYLDIDHLIVDLVQYQILQVVRRRYPKQSDRINKAYILDTDLNYKLDYTLNFDQLFNQEQQQKNQKIQSLQKMSSFTLQLSKIRSLIPMLLDFFNCLFDPILELIELTREEVSRLFEALKQTTNFFDEITQEEDAIIVFRIIFDCDSFLNQHLFLNSINYTNSMSIEQISQNLYLFTLGGVLGEYCSYITSQVRGLSNFILSFALLSDAQQFHKYFELSLSLSYAIKIKKNVFMKYQTKSFGYILGYLMDVFHESSQQSDDINLKMQCINFVRLYLTDFCSPSSNDQVGLFSASEFLIQLFQMRRNNEIVQNFRKLYEIHDLQEKDKMVISILLYYVLINIKKEKNKQENGPSYIIDSAIMVQIEKSFYEILDSLSQHKIDLRAVVKSQKLDFKDYKQTYNLLEFEFPTETIYKVQL